MYRHERKVEYLAKNKQEELYSLSNQFLEIFITDIFSKHQVKIEDVKAKISDEQREKLKETIEQLKDQVEDFLNTRNTKKIVTQEENNEQPTSPLRKRVENKRQAKSENRDSSNYH